uniref:Bladder cancer-associated protein n=1 Tax=Panagrellus redivivus TaxID=6233 RepID=A0A7E4ZS60_PANRE
MYCLQWLIPFLLIPKNLAVHPTFLFDQAMFFWIYMLGFFIERRPCYSCTLIFIVSLGFLCYMDSDRCVFWPSCETVFNGEMCKYVFDAAQSQELHA